MSVVEVRSGSKSKTLKPTPKIINIGDTYFGPAHKECKPFKLANTFLEPYNSKKPNFGFNGLGEFVFYRTYSRDKAEGGKESFLDVAKRVVEGCYEIQRRHCMSIHIPWDYERAQDSAQEMFERIWSFKFLPPGRGLWMMGTDFMYARGSAALNNCFSGDTEYITRDGIKTLKETVGTTQRVLAAGGKWVDAKIKAFGEQELYRLVVKRGVRYKTIMTTADHRWFVKSKQKNLVAANGVEGEKPVYKTRECHTTDLKNGMRLLSCYGSGIKNNYLRPSIVGIQHGICYGDGTTGSSDSNHGTYLYLCGPKNLGLLKYFQGFHVTPAPERGSEGAMRVADLPRFYRNAPVMNEASTYLYGWLAGYFAADGRITKLGTPQISSKHKENLEVVRSVCAILGIGTHDITSGYQTVRYEDGKVKKFLQYRITLYSDHLTDEFFLMEHHLERFKQRTARECSHYENWNVVSVEETGLKEETYCAQVPDYNSFALAGNILTGNCGMTSTDMKRHNDPAEPYCFMMDMSMLGVGIGFDTKGAGQVEIQRPNPAKYVEYEVHDSREGWVDSLRTLIHSYTKKSSNGEVIFNYEKIRPAGSTITGFGGTAAGANILSDMHEMFRRHLDRKVGKTLSSGDIVDLMNYIGKCVVAGNVRRTAQIAFGEAGDEEYSSLKNPYAFMPDNIKSMIQEKEGMAWGRATNSVAYLELSDFDTSSLTSEEIELLTQGTIQWSALNNHRWASNNSVFAKVGMPYKQYEKDIATNGEPGFLWLDNCRNFGRMIDGYKEGIDGEVVGSNPCFSGDMRLLTEDGYVSIYDLWVAGGMQEYSGLGDDPVGKYGSQKIVNNDGVVEATKVYKTGSEEDVWRVTMSDNSCVDATKNHEFIVFNRVGGKKKSLVQQRVKLSDLSVGNLIPLNQTVHFGGFHDPAYAELAGWCIGDGSLSPKKDGQVRAECTCYEGDVETVLPRLASLMHELYLVHNKSSNQNPAYVGWQRDQDHFEHVEQRVGSAVLGRLLKNDGVRTGDKHRVPSSIWSGTRETVAGFIRGFASADGYVHVSDNGTIGVRISQSNKPFLEQVRLLLNQFGIASAVHKRHDARTMAMNDGKGGKKDYKTKAGYELIVSGIKQVRSFLDQIGFIQNEKMEPARKWLQTHFGSNNSDTGRYVTVKSIEYVGKADTFCLTEPKTNQVVVEGYQVGQCAEQSLEDSELCCLVESFPNLHQDDEDYKRTLKFAFLYAKTVTLLPTHSARTNAVMLRNRRIGLSQSGIVQAFAQFGRREVLNKFCDEGYNVIKQWDKVYSKWLCIPQSIKITSVKPSGTVSLLTGCTPGIHYPEAQHYWRRVRVKSDSPLVQILKDAGYHVEPSVTDPVNTVVIKFAVSDPRVKPTNEVSIFEQVANTVDYQRYWADNQVSVTIKFKAEEAKDIASVLEIYEDQLKSISFLPHSNHGYAQAPYEPCTEQEVLDYNAQLKDLDFSAYYGKEEGSNFCDSDSCAI